MSGQMLSSRKHSDLGTGLQLGELEEQEEGSRGKFHTGDIFVEERLDTGDSDDTLGASENGGQLDLSNFSESSGIVSGLTSR